MATTYTMSRFFTSANPAAAAPELGAVRKMAALNNLQYMKNPSPYQKSTRAGNYPIINKVDVVPDNSFVQMTAANLHRVMRVMIGDIGKLLDTTSLPEKLQKKIAIVPKLEKTYIANIQPLKELHEEIYGTYDNPKTLKHPYIIGLKTDCPLYDDLGSLENDLSDYDRYYKLTKGQKEKRQNALKKAHKVNHAAGIVFASIDAQFANITTFRLTTSSKIINNTSSEPIPNFAQWLYYAGKAAQHAADTTVMTSAAKDVVKKHVGIQYGILPRIADHLGMVPEAREPEIMAVFEKSAEKACIAVANSGSFNDLSKKRETAYFMKVLGIDQNKYDLVTAQPAAAPKPAGRCPFGHDLKKN